MRIKSSQVKKRRPARGDPPGPPASPSPAPKRSNQTSSKKKKTSEGDRGPAGHRSTLPRSGRGRQTKTSPPSASPTRAPNRPEELRERRRPLPVCPSRFPPNLGTARPGTKRAGAPAAGRGWRRPSGLGGRSFPPCRPREPGPPPPLSRRLRVRPAAPGPGPLKPPLTRRWAPPKPPPPPGLGPSRRPPPHGPRVAITFAASPPPPPPPPSSPQPSSRG